MNKIKGYGGFSKIITEATNGFEYWGDYGYRNSKFVLFKVSNHYQSMNFRSKNSAVIKGIFVAT